MAGNQHPAKPWLGLVVSLGLCVCLATTARAGGGPENTLLVVNRRSLSSLTIANHYAQWRQIPAANVVALSWDAKAQSTDVDTFRAQILRPVLKAIEQRRLSGQIDYVVYSSDFPTAIHLQKDIDRFLTEATKAEPGTEEKPKEKPKWPTHLSPLGAINGLTYLWEPVLLGTPAYMQLQSNWYWRREVPEQKDAPTLAFHSQQVFGPHGELLPPKAQGRRYLLSLVLGVTAGRGNSLDEVLGYLRRCAAADGTHPRGTIYYMQNNDIRSKVRQDGFPAAVRRLKALGVEAEILPGVLPPNKPDVQGLMTGVADFDWPASKSTILPGAICEHFTSFGGSMWVGSGQTPLSAFLRYGAAGASGTVTEPYALHAKFPEPDLHVHYARGCTLAEAFYQSVAGPYQLLIVGDPLCRPWANIPKVTLSGVEPRARVQGPLTLKPAATFEGRSQADHFELFVDDLREGRCTPGQSFQLNTAKLADGYHELRIVAVEAGLIGSQGRVVVPIMTANHQRTIAATVEPKGTVPEGKRLTVTASSPGAMGITVLHNSHVVGKIAGPNGRAEIDNSSLGCGPVRLRVVGLGNGEPASYTWAEPIEVTVEKSR